MAFIGIFFLAILFLVFFVGTIISFIGLIVGIILNIIFTKKKNEGKTYGKVFAIISRVQIVICSILLVPCLILFVLIAVERTKVPSDFVETEFIVDYYNEEELKTNDLIYVPIKLRQTKYYGYYDYDEKVYSYMPSGTFNKNQWANFHTIKNNTGFEIICVDANPIYEYPLYCEKTNLDSILAYYNENNSWFYEDTLITNNTELLIDINNHITYYYSSEYVGYKYYIDRKTTDDIFRLDYLMFIEDDGSFFYVSYNSSIQKYDVYNIDEDLSNLVIDVFALE